MLTEVRPADETIPARGTRSDARRNLAVLLNAAMAVFAESGVDAPVREIADRAGVGVGTVYRHFPQRSDLIIAVFRNEVDACADAAAPLSAELDPAAALAAWMERFVDFIAAKRGLAAAIHSGDPAYEVLPAYFMQRLGPALATLLEAAERAGAIRPDVRPDELLYAAAGLSSRAFDLGPDHARRMVALLVDGLRFGAQTP